MPWNVWARFALVALVAVCLSGCAGDGDMPFAAAPESVVPIFQVDTSWPPPLPNNWVMGVPSSVAVDSRDHVWVLHRPRTVPDDQQANAAPPVLEFDAAGAFVQGWGGTGRRL